MLADPIPKDGPPSPPRSNSGEQPCDFQELSTNGDNTLYSVSKPVYGTDGQLTGYQPTAYDSPDTMNDHVNSQLIPYQSSEYNTDMGSSMDSRLQDVQDVQASMPYFPPYSIPGYHDPLGLAIAMNGYDTQIPAFDCYQSQESSSLKGEQREQGSHLGAPPTPTSPNLGMELRRSTRVNRTIESSESPGSQEHQTAPAARIIKRARKPQANKADKPNIPKLTAPLSKLTEEYQNVPVRDMKAYVNRSSEERREEAETKGKIPRPMNSFMLYRSAYAERTKRWGEQNNHQVVSSVTGQSWPLESAEVRNVYNEYAKIERANHQVAHPGYKFSPSKAQNGPRKRKQFEDPESELSDLTDPDDDWYQGPKRPKAKPRPRKRQAKAVTATPKNPYSDLIIDSFDVKNLSSYQATNPGRPIPAAIDDASSGHYYQTSIQASRFDPNVQDVIIRKMEAPGPNYGEAPRYYGYPSENTYETLQHRSYNTTPAPDESRVDPQLLAFDGSQPLNEMQHTIDLAQIDYESTFGTPYTTIDSDFGSDGDYLTAQPQAYHQVPAYHPGMQVLTDNSEWHTELGRGAPLDPWTNEQDGR